MTRALSVGYYSVTNCAGIEVLCVSQGIDPKVQFQWVIDSSVSGHRTWSKIRYDEDGEPFFITRGIKVYFNEIMRIEV